MVYHPGLERSQQFFDLLFVTDKVIVHHENHLAPAQIIEFLQFGQYLCRAFGARNAAIQHDNVAEFALKRTAARKLHGHRGVGLQIEQFEAWHRRRGDVGMLAERTELAGGCALFQRVNPERHGDFAFI